MVIYTAEARRHGGYVFSIPGFISITCRQFMENRIIRVNNIMDCSASPRLCGENLSSSATTHKQLVELVDRQLDPGGTAMIALPAAFGLFHIP
jgi:hypothetical protein